MNGTNAAAASARTEQWAAERQRVAAAIERCTIVRGALAEVNGTIAQMTHWLVERAERLDNWNDPLVLEGQELVKGMERKAAAYRAELLEFAGRKVSA